MSGTKLNVAELQALLAKAQEHEHGEVELAHVLNTPKCLGAERGQREGERRARGAGGGDDRAAQADACS